MGLLRAAALALQFGSLVGAMFIVGILGGRWLDERLDLSPLFLLVGLMLGLVGSAYVFYRIMTALSRADR
ncbi:MAG: AtpZ/AtpI family protein [Chloroflexota bacterium]|jgi:F0F1-type ATP synthase assembly protein I|nr:AtpZ/AtpI family protein [Chloroflexota bacterium]